MNNNDEKKKRKSKFWIYYILAAFSIILEVLILSIFEFNEKVEEIVCIFFTSSGLILVVIGLIVLVVNDKKDLIEHNKEEEKNYKYCKFVDKINNFNYNDASINDKKIYLITRLYVAAMTKDLIGDFYSYVSEFTTQEIKDLLKNEIDSELDEFVENVISRLLITKSVHSFEPKIFFYLMQYLKLDYHKTNGNMINLEYSTDKHSRFYCLKVQDEYLVVEESFLSKGSNSGYFETYKTTSFKSLEEASLEEQEMLKNKNDEIEDIDYFETIEMDKGGFKKALCWYLWNKNELEEKFQNLMTYYYELEDSNVNHQKFFKMHENDIENIIENLEGILPDFYLLNLKRTYNAFGEIDENEECAFMNDFFFQNLHFIEDIIAKNEADLTCTLIP